MIWHWPRLLASLGLLLAGVLLASCCSQRVGADLAAVRRKIQDRTTNHISDVVLFKPASDGEGVPLITQLAPLLIQVVPPTNGVALWLDQPAPTSGPPQIQARKDIVLINNRWHWQLTYTWSYAQGSHRIQGVRLTLDARDAPAIWEIYTDTSAQKIFYVSKAWEQAARAEFGAPFPGYNFSIERSQNESPGVVVANVIEDGPMAMGPILYLKCASHDVLTLICRCMPAQFQNLRDQKDYELRLPAAGNQGKSPFPAARLETLLRLPGSF